MNSASEIEAAAGEILLFRIPEPTQLTFVPVYDDKTSQALAGGDSTHCSTTLITTVDDLPLCQDRHDIHHDVGPTIHTTALLLYYRKLRQCITVLWQRRQRRAMAVQDMLLP